MEIKEINNVLSDAVSAPIALKKLGRNIYQISSPFQFNDGDEIPSYIELSNEKVRFSDRGHTLMHVSYDVELNSPTRQKIIEQVIATHELGFDEGEIFTETEIPNIGFAFWDFMQGLVKISDVSMWKFEKAAAIFIEEFEKFIESQVTPKVPLVENKWFEPGIDPNGLYAIPWVCLNGKSPLFIFPIDNIDRCSQAVISCLKYKEARYKFESLAVFDDIDSISRRTRNQCIDVVGKSYSNFSETNREDAVEYIVNHI